MTLAYYPPVRSKQHLQSRSRVLPRRYVFVRQLGKSAWQLAVRFGKRTTIHGLDKLLSPRSSSWERLVWLCTCFCAFLGTVFVCLMVSQRYSKGTFQTVVDNTRYPVYRIPFPVITICNHNRLNWQRLDQAKRQFMANVTDTGQLKLFERIVSSYDGVSFGRFESFKQFRNENTQQLSHINFSLVIDFMTWTCEELFSDCRWRRASVNCCDMFLKRRSQNGLCWAFNTIDSEEGKQKQRLDPMWPWRTKASGPNSALFLRVKIHQDKHFPGRQNEKGIDVMVTAPNVWHKDPLPIPANSYTTIEIEPTIYFYDNATRSMSSDQRRCIFDDEHSNRYYKTLFGYIYMIENCKSQCQQEYLVRYCNCTMDMLFPPDQFRSCRAPDLYCLAEHNEKLIYSHQPDEERYLHINNEGMTCKCYRSCYSLSYISDVRSAYLPAARVTNDSYVFLDVHFRFDAMMVYRTSLVFGWVDLLVSFGGIAGLFLGCSLISGMELAYFFFIEMPAFGLGFLRQRFLAKRRMDSTMNTPTFKLRPHVPNQLEHYLMQLKAEQAQQKSTGEFQKWQRQTFAHKHVISK